MDNNINNVLIVGGGTAGWLTACILAKQFASHKRQSIQVTLVESPDIPTIGVGEGTWPTMRRTLQNIGIDEGHFIKHCSATFKQGTQFNNWQVAEANQAPTDTSKVGHSYYNLFSSVYDPTDFNLAPYWALGHANKDGHEMAYANAVSAQALASEQGLAPKKITSAQYDAIQSYAYHLDAGKFAELLKQHAVDNLGVTHISANVQQVHLRDDGFIDSLDTDINKPLKADLFIDCSGFRSLLLGEALGVEFCSVSDQLFNDKAMAIQVPYDDPQQELACVTRSTAQTAGWIWDIGLINRRGVGHVYCSSYISEDEAETSLRRYIGDGDIDKHTDLAVKKIDMNVGYRKQFWKNNCVAVGLSAAFVEPLEASAIFLVEAAGNMIADLFPRNRAALTHAQNKFNQSFHYRWQRTIDFIKLHYVLSERQQPFWLDNKQTDSIPDSLLAKLDAWAHHPVSKYDFTDLNEPFPFESYQFVLHGMGFKQNLHANADSFAMVETAQQYFQNIQRATQHICAELPSHRELVEKVCQYGFSKL